MNMDLTEIVESLHHIRISGKVSSTAESFALGFAEGLLYAESMKERQVTTVYTESVDDMERAAARMAEKDHPV